ncbi:hypothetical protein QW060_23240 [Myroides ceti]|uniref:Uncharacterized protein n=1 Tax=Paenimyroides ceti TaxID=395087 RepID=A0ABT8D3I0_9FLAO|nr:hypothetical protein [Paenimyroides ceti]MDN3709852.1 hypothetical protein [Paenimyroides ceti]
MVDIHQGKLPPTSLDYFVILWIINDTTLILEKEALSVEKTIWCISVPEKELNS